MTPAEIREAVRVTKDEGAVVTGAGALPPTDRWYGNLNTVVAAALAYADVLERGVVVVKDDNGQWPRAARDAVWHGYEAWLEAIAVWVDGNDENANHKQLDECVLDALEAAQREATPQKCHCLAPSSCEHAQREMG